jgi:septum formation protein
MLARAPGFRSVAPQPNRRTAERRLPSASPRATLQPMPPQLVLASTSPYRRQLLARLCVPFECTPPGIDEAACKRELAEPLAIVRELARQKALAVAGRHPEAIVIGSDQGAATDGHLLDKPGTVANAIGQLERLQGREHELLTAAAIVHRGAITEFVETTRLTMRPLTSAEITRYVERDQPLDCAGSYRIEGLGIALFTRIDGSDHTAIIGLPLLRLCAELRRLGVRLP